MLAMDVVDVLRHQEALVAAELDDEGRRRALVERVQSIYASQGLDVPASVVERGVKALEEDRFRYRPPERTLAVRLAEVYVERGRWARRALVVLGVVALVWGGIAWAGHRRDRAMVERYAARAAGVRHDADEAAERAKALEARIVRAREGGPASGVVADLLREAESGVAAARDRLAQASAAGSDPDRYPQATTEMDAALDARRRALGTATDDLGRAAGQVEAVERLRSLRADLARVLARLAGVEPPAEDRAAVERARSQVEAAADAGDEARGRGVLADLERLVERLVRGVETRRRVESGLAASLASLEGVRVEPAARRDVDALAARARAALSAGDVDGAVAPQLELADLARELGLAYELRIVSRPNERSGVWRESVDRPGTRNYYLLVEAVGPDGRALDLSVRNEEDGRTERVRTFGVRVPQEVYDAVRADKQDNGIVDRNVLGVKRRGAREP
jgi:hypothetical protein